MPFIYPRGLIRMGITIITMIIKPAKRALRISGETRADRFRRSNEFIIRNTVSNSPPLLPFVFFSLPFSRWRSLVALSRVPEGEGENKCRINGGGPTIMEERGGERRGRPLAEFN